MPLSIIRQDITKISCDAIVNPTNEHLIPGGGTDAAIHAAAGQKLAEACEKIGTCAIGEAIITPAYNLPCKYILHTVGPVWQNGAQNERELLESCYRQSLQLAKQKKCKTVAFPLISSGTYGFPKDQVLKIAMSCIGAFLGENEMTVFIVVYDKTSYALSQNLADEVTAFIDDRYTEEEPPIRKSLREANARSRTVGRNTLSQYSVSEDACPTVEPHNEPILLKQTAVVAQAAGTVAKHQKNSLEDRLKNMDKGFAQTLFDYIDAKGMDDVTCYKRANVDRKTFSKIKCSKNYKPSKQTVLSFAIALELTIEETCHLLNTVGMALSRSSKFDVIVAYFIENGKYDIYEINETLFAFDQMLLGA